MSASAGIGCCQILLWSGLVVRLVLLVLAPGGESRCARRCCPGRLAWPRALPHRQSPAGAPGGRLLSTFARFGAASALREAGIDRFALPGYLLRCRNVGDDRGQFLRSTAWPT